MASILDLNNVDLVCSNGIQNVADAAVLYQGSAADFPNEMAVTNSRVAIWNNLQQKTQDKYLPWAQNSYYLS